MEVFGTVSAVRGLQIVFCKEAYGVSVAGSEGQGYAAAEGEACFRGYGGGFERYRVVVLASDGEFQPCEDVFREG